MLNSYLSFIGIQDVEFVYAEGLNMGDDIKAQAVNDAEVEIDNLVA
ncbi:hypothetical protein [Endozoicomonas sp.]